MALDPLTAVLEIGSKVIDRVWADPAQAANAKLELFKAQQAGEFKELEQKFELAKAQIEVNQAEATSSSVFVAGARPFVMWVCGFAMAYVSVIEPIARFIAVVTFHYAGQFPVIDTDLTLQVLFGILGLGAFRSVEKIKGAAK